MNTVTSRILIYGIAFLLTLISGVILTRLGKPFNTAFFTIHKLAAVGTVILIGMNVYHLNKAAEIHAASLAVVAVTALLFLVLLVSGALLSLDIRVQQSMRIHQVTPLLALVSSSIGLYLLAGSEALNRIGLVR